MNKIGDISICDSCGKNFLDHLGMRGTCKMLQEVKEALKWYADLDNYKSNNDLGISEINMEKGTRARMALEKIG